MSGVERVGPSIVSTTTADVAMPPPAAAPEAEREDAIDLATDVAMHDGAELAAGLAESGVIGGGVAAGAVLSGVGWAVSLVAMAHATVESGDAGTREGALYAAMGGDGSATSRAFGAGIAACMLDASSRELGAIRDSLPLSLQDDFAAGVENAHEAASREPVGWMEARAEYREVFRDYTDGRAAALGGWNDPSRGEVFTRAREEMTSTLAADPAAASAARATYHSNVRAGFMAAESGHVNEERFTFDAAYRAGVTYERTEASHGSDALEAARARVVGFRAGSGSHAPISG